jgi:hypothetical protein
MIRVEFPVKAPPVLLRSARIVTASARAKQKVRAPRAPPSPNAVRAVMVNDFIAGAIEVLAKR